MLVLATIASVMGAHALVSAAGSCRPVPNACDIPEGANASDVKSVGIFWHWPISGTSLDQLGIFPRYNAAPHVVKLTCEAHQHLSLMGGMRQHNLHFYFSCDGMLSGP